MFIRLFPRQNVDYLVLVKGEGHTRKIKLLFPDEKSPPCNEYTRRARHVKNIR